MADFKGIPVVPSAARSGQKYLTPQGITAIKDGVKRSDVNQTDPAAPGEPCLHVLDASLCSWREQRLEHLAFQEPDARR